MSIMSILAGYQAVLGVNNAQYSTMQNNQSRMAMVRGAGNFGSTAALASADKRLEMQNAVNGVNAQANSVMLDSMEAARKKHQQAEGVGGSLDLFA